MISIKDTKPIKTKVMQVRMTQEEFDKLNYCADKLNDSKTNIVNTGIDNIYQNIKKIDEKIKKNT